MKRSNFERNYCDLIQISDEGAVIFGSRMGEEIVTEGCPDISDFPIVPILKMQLEQESFFHWSQDWEIRTITDMQGFSRAFHEALCGYINGRLEGLCLEERRGALLALLCGLEAQDMETWEACSQTVAARLPEEKLVSMAAGRIECYARQLCMELEYEKTAGETVNGAEEAAARCSCTATAAALALAAYAEYMELQCVPELLADTSAFAAEIACGEKKEEGQEAFTVSAYVLLLASALITDFLTAPFLASAGVAVVGMAGWFLEKVKQQFQALMKLFSAQLKTVMGRAATDLLAEVPAILADYVPETEETLLPETESAVVESLTEAEAAEEDEEEYEGEWRDV